jgi:hypothetical protein
MNDLRVWLRIIQSLTLLPLGTAINRVPLKGFPSRVVVKAVRKFPQFVDVAYDIYHTLGGYISAFEIQR